MQREYIYGAPCECVHCRQLPHVHRPVHLAIIGSTSLDEQSPRPVYNAILTLIDTILHSSDIAVVISGGAKGIDTWAERRAKLAGLPTQIYLPKVPRWHDGFKPRNEQIAQACTHLVRIAASDATTYGSGWTRDRARALGKPTFNYVVDVTTGEITETES